MSVYECDRGIPVLTIRQLYRPSRCARLIKSTEKNISSPMYLEPLIVLKTDISSVFFFFRLNFHFERLRRTEKKQ